ncbi:probable chitinase 10 [Spodoptera litura]|uniref:Probable chitinase 10 n=1 Tax=Spodoptera litura TaxID=69820 RepID=A0A9J7E7P7_SPOLT|nr:probable chitinase 10 [Spodoptera litura]
MYKLLLLSCLLASCLAGPHDVPSWIRDASRPPWRGGRGCADRRAGWEACAHVNSTVSLAPHPRDCRLFFYCSSIGIGIPLVCRRCPAGLHFNPELLVCDWPNNVNCTAGPPPRPRPTLHPTDSTALPTDTTVIYSETPTPVAESTVAETSDQPTSMSTPPQY